MGALYLIATPIGNIEDISARAINTFKIVDILYAEDTRETKKLLSFYDIDKRIKCLNDHNELSLSEKIIADLNKGLNVGLVSDRGTPLISDPGYKIVNRVLKEDFKVISIPGPVAFINALISSGLPTDKFAFLGFIKYKRKALANYVDLPATLIFYESPKRIEKLITYLFEELGERDVVIARELTKKYESFYFGSLSNILSKQIEYKGEFVVMVGPSSLKREVDIEAELSKLIDLDKKKIIELLLKEKYQVSKNEIYSYLYRKE